MDELNTLNKAAQSGKATTKTLQKGFVTTVVPLENAARKNPYNAEYEYGELIAQKITADAAKLKAAGTVDDAAPLLQKLCSACKGGQPCCEGCVRQNARTRIGEG